MWVQKSKRTSCLWKRLYLESCYSGYASSFIDNSVITCDEIIEETKTKYLQQKLL